MGRKIKPTHQDKLLMKIYEELLKKNKEVPLVDEVWKIYNERYGRRDN